MDGGESDEFIDISDLMRIPPGKISDRIPHPTIRISTAPMTWSVKQVSQPAKSPSPFGIHPQMSFVSMLCYRPYRPANEKTMKTKTCRKCVVSTNKTFNDARPSPLSPASPHAHGFELGPLIGFFPRVSEEVHGSASLFEDGTMDVDGT